MLASIDKFQSFIFIFSAERNEALAEKWTLKAGLKQIDSDWRAEIGH